MCFKSFLRRFPTFLVQNLIHQFLNLQAASRIVEAEKPNQRTQQVSTGHHGPGGLNVSAWHMGLPWNKVACCFGVKGEKLEVQGKWSKVDEKEILEYQVWKGEVLCIPFSKCHTMYMLDSIIMIKVLYRCWWISWLSCYFTSLFLNRDGIRSLCQVVVSRYRSRLSCRSQAPKGSQDTSLPRRGRLGCCDTSTAPLAEWPKNDGQLWFVWSRAAVKVGHRSDLCDKHMNPLQKQRWYDI